MPIGVGVATGGRVDDGTIVEHSQLGWKDVRAKEFLTTALDTAVQVESHSRALARAEQLFGSDPRARTSLVHLFVGNVVDAAIVTGGAVHSGPLTADRAPADRQARWRRAYKTFAGTALQVADTIEEWHRAGAADGFNIIPAALPSGLERFADEVLPILRQRGLFRTKYTGTTPREHYGLPRPANRFALPV